MNITVALRTLALDANRRVADALADLGLTFCQYTLLDVIAEQPYINSSAAAAVCGITPQTAGTSIASLIGYGYVRNMHEEGMGRVNPLTVTEAGGSALDVARRAMHRMDMYYDSLLNISNHPIDVAGEVAFVANNLKTFAKD